MRRERLCKRGKNRINGFYLRSLYTSNETRKLNFCILSKDAKMLQAHGNLWPSQSNSHILAGGVWNMHSPVTNPIKRETISKYINNAKYWLWKKWFKIIYDELPNLCRVVREISLMILVHWPQKHGCSGFSAGRCEGFEQHVWRISKSSLSEKHSVMKQ